MTLSLCTQDIKMLVKSAQCEGPASETGKIESFKVSMFHKPITFMFRRFKAPRNTLDSTQPSWQLLHS